MPIGSGPTLGLYAWGNTTRAFNLSSSAISDVTTAGLFDANFVASAIKCPNHTSFFDTMPFLDAAAPTTVWTKCTLSLHNNNEYGTSQSYLHTQPTTPYIYWINSSGVTILYLRRSDPSGLANGGVAYQFFSWNGSAYVAAGAGFELQDDLLYKLSVKIVGGASSSFIAYVGSAIVAFASFNSTAVDNVARIRFSGAFDAFFSNTITANYSQIAVASFDLRSIEYAVDTLTGNGFRTDGTGTYADVNDSSDATALALPTSGNQRTFVKTARTLPAGYTPLAVTTVSRARVGTTGPTDGKALMRQSSTDYLGAAFVLNGGYEPRGAYASNDPATGAPFTQAGYNSVEIGVQAV